MVDQSKTQEIIDIIKALDDDKYVVNGNKYPFISPNHINARIDIFGDGLHINYLYNEATTIGEKLIVVLCVTERITVPITDDVIIAKCETAIQKYFDDEVGRIKYHLGRKISGTPTP